MLWGEICNFVGEINGVDNTRRGLTSPWHNFYNNR